MLRLTPPTSMSSSAAMTLSGMLMAATMVLRTLSRNRKMTMTAMTAPRAPSLTRPSIDCSMKSALRKTEVVVRPSSASSSAIVSSIASVTSMVFASDALMMEIPTDG